MKVPVWINRLPSVGLPLARFARSPSGEVEPVLVAILAVALLLGFFYLGTLPLFDEDEGEYAEVTVEMVARRDPVTPYLNGQLFFEKPILIFWLQAPWVALFGPTEFAFRAPSAIAGALWMLAIFAFARRHYDRQSALAAAIIASTSIGVCIYAHGATMEAVLNLFLATAMFDFYRYWLERRTAALRRAFLWMGLGFLAKGPVAIVIPLAASALFACWMREPRRWLRAALDPAGWAIFLIVAAPWYVLEYRAAGQPFLDYFFLRENLQRFSSPLQGHSGPLFYYLPVALVLMLPYTGLLLRVLPEVRRFATQPLGAFLTAWFLVVLVLFSLAATKLPHYLLYGMTPVFILLGAQRETLQSRPLALLPALLFGVLVLCVPGIVGYLSRHYANPYVRAMLARGEAVFDARYYMAAAGLLLLVLVLAAWRRVPAWRALLVCGLATDLLLWHTVLPAVAELQQGPVKEAALFARKLGEPVIADNSMPSFSVYFGHPTTVRAPRPGDVVFTRVDWARDLPPHTALYEKGGITLLRMR